MPVLPASLFEPLWVQFSALLPEHPRVASTHPLGCHREWIPDRLVFEHVIAALVHGSGYERIATSGCSDRTIRRRLADWAEMGLAEQVHRLALAAYERMIGLDLADLAVDGCITKAPGGGEVAGRSPVDRSKQGLKRSVLTEGAGIPLHVIPAGANRHDARLLAPPSLAWTRQLPSPTPSPGPSTWIRAMPGRRPACCSTSWVWTEPSPARGCRHHGKRACGGRWSGRTVG